MEYKNASTKLPKINIQAFFCFTIFMVLLFSPNFAEASTTNLPSGWNRGGVNDLVTYFSQLSEFIYSFPMLVLMTFACAGAIYACTQVGSPMPLISTIGIGLLAAMVPLILNLLYDASGMILP